MKQGHICTMSNIPQPYLISTKHSTDSNIVTKLSIENAWLDTTQQNAAFTKVLSKWQCEDWVDYLYKNAEIYFVDSYKDAATYTTVYVLKWAIPPDKKTWFLLKWSEKLDKAYT